MASPGPQSKPNVEERGNAVVGYGSENLPMTWQHTQVGKQAVLSYERAAANERRTSNERPMSNEPSTSNKRLAVTGPPTVEIPNTPSPRFKFEEFLPTAPASPENLSTCTQPTHNISTNDYPTTSRSVHGAGAPTAPSAEIGDNYVYSTRPIAGRQSAARERIRTRLEQLRGPGVDPGTNSLICDLSNVENSTTQQSEVRDSDVINSVIRSSIVRNSVVE